MAVRFSLALACGVIVAAGGCMPHVDNGGGLPGAPQEATRLSDRAGGLDDRLNLTVKEIGDRVEARYRNAKSIRIEGATERAGHRLEFMYEGSQEALRTLCKYKGEVYGLFSFDRGRIQEFVPGHSQRLVLMYDSEYDDQVPNLVYARPLDCLYGMQFGLWVGPKSILRFGNNIRNGRHVRNQQIGDRLCYVVEWDRYFEGNEEQSPLHLTHVYYVDSVEYVVRRWDSIRNDDVQTREFSVMDVGSGAVAANWDLQSIVDQLVPASLLDEMRDASFSCGPQLIDPEAGESWDSNDKESLK